MLIVAKDDPDIKAAGEGAGLVSVVTVGNVRLPLSQFMGGVKIQTETTARAQR